MKVQSYFNVFSKVGLIFPLLHKQFAIISASCFNETFIKSIGQNMIFNWVLSSMSPFWDLDFGKIRPNFQCTVFSLVVAGLPLKVLHIQFEKRYLSYRRWENVWKWSFEKKQIGNFCFGFSHRQGKRILCLKTNPYNKNISAR